VKDGFKDIVGKRISDVIVAHNKLREPKDQVFLVFDDDTHYELYGSFTSAGGTDRGGREKAAAYATDVMKAEIEAVYSAPRPLPKAIVSIKPPLSSGGPYAKWEIELLENTRNRLMQSQHKMMRSGWLGGITFAVMLIAIILGAGAVLDIVRHGVDKFSGVAVVVGGIALVLSLRHDRRFKSNAEMLAAVNAELRFRNTPQHK
jgi:hypothetical protein